MGGYQNNKCWDNLRCGTAHMVSNINSLLIKPKKLSYEAIVNCSPPPPLAHPPPLTQSHTDIVDSRSTEIYYEPNTTITNTDPTVPNLQVGTANGHMVGSHGTNKYATPELIQSSPTMGHVMPTFKHTLIGLGPF